MQRTAKLEQDGERGQKRGGTRKAARNDESGRRRRTGRQESRPDATAAAQISRLVGGRAKALWPPPAAVFVADLPSRVWQAPAEEMMPRYL